MTEIVEATMTLDEALALDKEIVDGAEKLRERLLKMYDGRGYEVMGFPSFRQYLTDLGDRIKYDPKALRRIHKAALLEEGSGKDIGTFKEGSIRPIIDTLSDNKGFTQADRNQALDLAIEFAGGDEDKLTSSVAQTAAYYVEVEKLTPVGLERLPERMKHGEVTTEAAHRLCHLMLGERAKGIEDIIAECSDYELAQTLIKLRSSNGDTWTELEGTIRGTGCLPSTNGNQIPIGNATNGNLIDHLNEPMRMVRYEKAVDRTEKLASIAKLAAQMITEYWGVHEEVPEALEGQETESALYAALLELGYIRYGSS